MSMQAIILAAGMGKRLKELTSNATKCMVEVNGVTMIEKTLGHLEKLGLKRIVFVIGYEGQKLKSYVESLNIKTPLEFIDNDVYYKTNNIYSLYLAKEKLVEDDTLLLESDLVYEEAVIRKLVDHPYPSLTLVDKFESWMDGTCVTLDEDDNITAFLSKREFDFSKTDEYYKTVNLYKFSKEFSQKHYVPFLEAYCKALGTNEYYEQVLKVITFLDDPQIKAVKLNGEKWYEIDDVQDLDIAETLFATKEERLKRMQSRYGGYWRYPKLLDFCYLVNPYFPCRKLIDEMKSNFETLLTEYPSGMSVNSLIAAKDFGLHKDQMVVGNGASELIKSLMEQLPGKIGVVKPTFEEYPNRKNAEDVIAFLPSNEDYSYSAEDLMNYYADKDIKTLLLINPDNPSGNYIPKKDVLLLAAWAEEREICLIVDESFVDFADETDSSLLEQAVLTQYPHLFVMKSISKSYGVPGIRLGILAGDNKEMIAKLKKDVSIWNINSFGEFYLQIYEKYAKDYKAAMDKFRQERRAFVNALAEVRGLRVIPSQANYLLCELTNGESATKLAEDLLDEDNILIKDLSTKKGFEGRNYIRIAIRDEKDNEKLVVALKKKLN